MTSREVSTPCKVWQNMKGPLQTLDRNFSMAFEPCPGIHHLFLYAKYRIIMPVVAPLDKMVLH